MHHKRCPNCGFLNPSFKFCGECGTSLESPARPRQIPAVDTAVMEDALPHRAEHRQLTVLFCDIVDSTAFSEKLDPEELRNLLEVYRTCIMEVVLAQDGHIARYFGDGILVYFGYPIAHEDAAHRAVRAALGSVAALETLNPYLQASFGVEIRVRLSIDTGLVVVWHISGDASPEAIDIVGKTPNIAARMQALATPNSIVIGDTTHQLVEGFFETAALGTFPIRGISQPVNVYQVSGEIPAQSRLDIASESGLTPLIGRAREVESLKHRWAQVLASKGQALLIEGEAGIGKSRCLQVIQEHVENHPEAVTMECRCSPYYQNSPLYPILSLFQEHVVQFSSTDTAQTRLDKLENLLRDYRIPTVRDDAASPSNFDGEAQEHAPETLPLLAELLEIPLEVQQQTGTGVGARPYSRPVEQDTYPSGWGRRQRRQQTLEVLVQVLLKMAEQKPILFVVEDLHWIDPSSIEFLTLLITRIENARIFAVLSCRTGTQRFRESSQAEESGQSLQDETSDSDLESSVLDTEMLEQLLRPEWTNALTLAALTPPQVEEMIQHVAGDTALPSEALTRIVEMTEGVPLFVEELTQMMLEGDTLTSDVFGVTDPRSQTMEVPVTLQDLLTVRLDELGPAKEIVQLGATLGREWTAELLHEVASGLYPRNRLFADFATLKSELNTLVSAYILNQDEMADTQLRYTFRHPLLRETAYQSLLRSRRQRYHQRIAEVLQGDGGFQPELVAYHYTEAGLPEKAIDYWHRAGQRSLERSANVEGIRHITQGLAALEQLSADTNLRKLASTAQQELELQTILGSALIATKGYAAPEVEGAYTRARELLETLESQESILGKDADTSLDRVKDLRFPILFGLWLSHLVRGRFLSAHELGEQCFVIAKQAEDAAFEVEAHRALGATLYYLSEFKEALAHLEAGIELYQPQQHPVPTFLHFVADPGTTLLAYSAPLLWCLGYPLQAEERLVEAAKIGEDRNHPFSDAVLLHFKAVLYQHKNEVEMVETTATQMLRICQEHGFSLWEAAATVMKGWALTELNRSEAGIAMIRKGIAAWEKTRAELLLPLFLTLLAQAYQRAGQYTLALQTLDSALSVVTRTGERAYDAELTRRKGELCFVLGKEPEAVGEREFGVTNPSYNTFEKAESYFQEALAIARRQGAKSWELRAALSLSELWCTQDRYREAYNLLRPIYVWFSEGFETKDLQHAKHLLEKLQVALK
ncbi:AAA family ATPase [Candidatus Poribacteria bacterium]|nr:AAA family ATPase [Candidatus Poribacteria bacterium]MYA56413.1 AAA family ATPase [Candidatus Poribacteria bacterium]